MGESTDRSNRYQIYAMGKVRKTQEQIIFGSLNILLKCLWFMDSHLKEGKKKAQGNDRRYVQQQTGASGG